MEEEGEKKSQNQEDMESLKRGAAEKSFFYYFHALLILCLDVKIMFRNLSFLPRLPEANPILASLYHKGSREKQFGRERE